MTQPIDASYPDIQGNILRPFPTQTAGYFFLAITDPAMFRRALGTVLSKRVTSESEVRAGRPLASVLQVGFTHAGLRRIGLAEKDLAAFPESYAAGMARRAPALGDLGPSDPLTWEAPFGTDAIHVVVCVLSAGADPGEIDAAWRQLCADGAVDGTTLLHDCRGASVIRRSGDQEYREEPFGFRDGISQPDVDLPDTPPADGTFGRIAPGEFILGYADESDREIRRDPAPVPALLQNGTYMVFRKMQQHPAALDAFIAATRTADDDKARLRAELVGRWPNGARLGTGPQPAAPGNAEANDFLFATSGDACPVWSHIRRANPRNGLGSARHVRRHRIIRRGIRYTDAGGETGVLFVCFNARIDDQFEFIQANWLNSGNFVGLPSGNVDPIASSGGDGTATYPRPGGGAAIAHLPSLTRVRGGEYFLLPGRAALAALAALDPAPAPAVDAPAASDEIFDFATMGLRALAEDAPSKALEWAGGRRERIYFVGQHDLVTKTLRNDQDFEVTPYDGRITAVTGGGRLMVGLSPVRDAQTRTARRALLASVMPNGASQAGDVEIVRAIVEGALARVDAANGPINAVEAIARTVPLAVLVNYLGVRPPETLSELAVAAFFARAPGDLPEEWRKTFTLPPGTDGMYSLAFWTRLLFVHTFANIVEAPEIRDLAALATQEFLAHLDQLMSTPPPGTLLERAVASGAPRDDARLLMLELAVGGTDTTATGITNVLDLLLDRPDAMQAARTAVRGGAADADLDAIIQECLRLAPVAGMLSRRSTERPATIGQTPIEPNSLVCVLTGAAANDPRVFPDGRAFRTDRPAAAYRNFGDGAHACAGQWLALVQLRTVLRWLLGPAEADGGPRFPHLRRAAGPKGRKVELLGLPESLYLWLD